MRSALTILNEMLFAVGKTTTTVHSSIDPYQILNRAGRQIYTAHDWRWRDHGPVTLHTVASQNFVSLPRDFAAPLDLTVSSGGSSVEIVTAKRIGELRQSTVTVSGSASWFVAYPWTSQQNSESLPEPRMGIYPTPATADNPLLLLRYKRKWLEAGSSNPNLPVNIPNEAEQLLILCGTLMCLQKFTPGNVGEIATTRQAFQEELARLMQEDAGGAGQNFGRMRGGADDFITQEGATYAPRITSYS